MLQLENKARNRQIFQQDFVLRHSQAF